MTKEVLKFSIQQYIENETNITSYATLKKKVSTLSSFLKKYNEKKTLHDNIADFLKDNSTLGSFRVSKMLLKNWLSFANIKCDIEDIQFQTNFITDIGELNNTIDKAMNNPDIDIWSVEVSAYFCYVKLMCYLLWVGVSKSALFKMKKGDYDIGRRIIYVEQQNGKKQKIDLTSEYFSDVSDILHKELCDNIYSLHFEKETQNICGKLRDVTTYNNANVSKAYNINDYLFRPISSGTSSVNVVNSIRTIIVPKICLKLNIISKSGFFYRARKYLLSVYKTDDIGNKNGRNLSQALDFLDYNLTRKGIVQEYKIYLEQCSKKSNV
mgnify:CR=1 FL=1